MATGIFDFDLRNMSMLFVGDTFYVLIYTIENVCHIGPRGVVIHIKCGSRSYTIYAYVRIVHMSVYPSHGDVYGDMVKLLHRIHKEANLQTKELQDQLGRSGVFCQLKILEDLQKWRRRCMDYMV